MTSEPNLRPLERMAGQRLVGASRIVYEHEGTRDTSNGDLELSFAGGSVLLLAGAGDGERLAAQPPCRVIPWLFVGASRYTRDR